MKAIMLLLIGLIFTSGGVLTFIMSVKQNTGVVPQPLRDAAMYVSGIASIMLGLLITISTAILII